MQSYEELLQTFELYLNQYSFPEKPSYLYEACKHILAIGGKRVRPVASLLSFQIFKPIDKSALDFALAIELFHNFSLIHDDIMDQADLRRGKASVHNQFGIPTAILSGDVLSIITFQLLNNINTEHRQELLEQFSKMAIEVCEGQQMDMNFENQHRVMIEDYIEMIKLKTSVLLAHAISSAALLAQAPSDVVKELYEFGLYLGIAFQLRDDYLDCYGDEKNVGKKIGGDILANKKTILYNHAVAEGFATELDKTSALEGEEKINITLDIFEKAESKNFTLALIRQYSDKAFNALTMLKMEKINVDLLEKLGQQLLNRNS